MTEYDYSPDAVKRYYAKQNSVARWVDRQAYESRKYGNPFLPEGTYASPAQSGGTSPTGNTNLARSASTPIDPHARHGHGHGHAPVRATTTAQRTGHRTYSSNVPTPTVTQGSHRYTAGGTATGTATGSSSQTHSRSQSHSAAYRRPPPARSQTYQLAQASASATHLSHARPPTRSQTLPSHAAMQAQQAQYTSAPGQTVVMHNGRQTYVVVPPHGTRVQVCSPQAQSPTYTVAPAPTYPQGYNQGGGGGGYLVAYAQQPVSPTHAKKPPLLKRLFGGSQSGSNATVAAANGGYARRSGSTVPVMTTAGARRRTTSMHY